MRIIQFSYFFFFFHSLNFFQIWIHAMREGPPWVGVEWVRYFLGDQGLDMALALLNSEVFVLASHECLDTSVPMATDKFYRNATI